jgi:hypothetical protein
METIEIKEEVNGNGKGTLTEVMAQLVNDAENVIEDIGEEVRQELADEIEKIKDQFEKKKNQIMENAKKNANDKTIKITDKIRETLSNKFEQASTNKILEVFEQANHEIEDMVKLQPASATKTKKEVSTGSKPEGEVKVSQVEGKNEVETKHDIESAKNDNKDEMAISSIQIDDETEPKLDFDDWLK